MPTNEPPIINMNSPEFQKMKLNLEKHSPKIVVFGVMILVIVGFVLGLLSSGITRVEPGQVAVIKNNLWGAKPEVQTSNKTIIHLPFGITDVYLLDKQQQVYAMTSDTKSGARRKVDNVKVKTVDGADIWLDVEIKYEILPDKAEELINKVGAKDAYKEKVMRSYARTFIRDELGRLTLKEIAISKERDAKIQSVKTRLNDLLQDTFFIRIANVSATKFKFHPKYDELIKERKSADQERINEHANLARVVEDQKRRIAEATKDKSISITQIKGEQQKLKIAAGAEAKKQEKLADAAATKTRLEGEQILASDTEEAKAIETEGRARAEGVLKMVSAYAKGGEALLREALAAKYQGRAIQGKPYTLDSNIKRLQVERRSSITDAAIEEVTR